MTTAMAVSGVVVLGGGVAGAEQMRQHSGHQQEADSEAAHLADAQATNDIAARTTAAGGTNRDLARPPLVAVTTPSGASGSRQVELFDRNLTPTAAGSTGAATPASAAGPTGPALPSASSTGPAPTSAAPTGPTSASSSTSSPKATPSTSPTSKPPTTTSSTGGLQGYNATPAQARALAQQLVPTGQFACFDDIITRESSWNMHATNASSGAYGLAQALPGDKMGTVASDWRTNAVTQIKWAIGYMTSRYGSPCAAWAFWQNHHWY